MKQLKELVQLPPLWGESLWVAVAVQKGWMPLMATQLAKRVDEEQTWHFLDSTLQGSSVVRSVSRLERLGLQTPCGSKMTASHR